MPKCLDCGNSTVFTHQVSGYATVVYEADGSWYSRNEETEIDFSDSPACGDCTSYNVLE